MNEVADFLFDFFGKDLKALSNGFQKMFSYLSDKVQTEEALNHPLVKAIRSVTWVEAYRCLFDEYKEDITEEMFYKRYEEEDEFEEVPYLAYWEYNCIIDFPSVIKEHLENDECCILYKLPNGNLIELPWMYRYNIKIEDYSKD